MDVNLGFTVANIRLHIDNVCIAYDDIKHYTQKQRRVCVKAVSTTVQPSEKITSVRMNDLFHMRITGNYFIEKYRQHYINIGHYLVLLKENTVRSGKTLHE